MDHQTFRLINDCESYLLEISSRNYEETQLYQLSVLGWQNVQHRARELKRALAELVISSREFSTGNTYQMTLVVRCGSATVAAHTPHAHVSPQPLDNVEQLVRFCSSSLGQRPLTIDPLPPAPAPYEPSTSQTPALQLDTP